jgi:hypothetical protein
MDRRRSHRYDFEGPVTFLWRDQQSAWQRGQGSARDISDVGIFVFSDYQPPVGSTVQLETCFAHTGLTESVQIQASGEIIRVDEVNESQVKRGFAVSTDSLKLFDSRPGHMSSRF